MRINVSKLAINASVYSRLTRVAPFEGGKSEWKKDAEGKLVLDGGGNPIWLNATGAEQSVAGDTIARLNGEAKTHREAKEAAEAKLKAFEDAGVTDAKVAGEALVTVGKIKQGELIAAGKVDEVRNEITKSFDKKITEAEAKANAATARLNGMLVQSAFQGSKYIGEKLSVPHDVVQAMFRDKFKIVDDRLIAIGSDGKDLYSPKRAGELADFDEAVEHFVDTYPNKDRILKGANNSGSGNGGNGGNGPGGKRNITREEFGKMTPAEQSKTATEVRTGTVALVD